MLVPRFWAETRLKKRVKAKRFTVRRFGWSDTSQAEAQTHAEQRAQQAMQELLSGVPLLRREPKIPYNGAEGIPIREEIVDRVGDSVITRNSYGARCLNTPNVLFVDIDFQTHAGCRLILSILGLFLLTGLYAIGWTNHRVLGYFLIGVGFLGCVPIAHWLFHGIVTLRGGPTGVARSRVARFVARHTDWNLRIYRTPLGMRVLATHRTFAPDDPQALECFRALKADPLYVRMCLNQRCFRARVSPKPWRAGISSHITPRPGVWPVSPEKLPERNRWIADYESAAKSFASCQFLESFGNGLVHSDVNKVVRLHDELCQAMSNLPIA